MTKLIWNESGKRYYEIGVDRGVFYLEDSSGVPWNGLTSVSESPSGSSPTSFYIDGIKYLTTQERKEFGGKIEAFTYPDEFAEYDGWAVLDNGIIVDEQDAKPFGLSYRSFIGNDIDGSSHGYKIHLVYNALATPSDMEHTSLGEQDSPETFSWSFTTTPVIVANADLHPISHVVIDSTKTNPTQLKFIEEYLYGTDDRTLYTGSYMYLIPGENPQLPPIEELFALFANPMVTMDIIPKTDTGLNTFIDAETINGDLRGRRNEGLYVAGENTRLTPYGSPGSGLFTLGNG